MSKKKMKGNKSRVEHHYQLGGTIGRGIAAASNLIVPGLGTVLSPVLGGIGDSIDQKQAVKKQRNKQFSTISETDNPYGYANGGPITPRPVAAESTRVQQPLINYNDNRTKQTLRPSAMQRFISRLRGTSAEYDQMVGDFNAGIDRQNQMIRERGIADQPQWRKLAYGGKTDDYSTGGALKGKLDFATYYGRKHKHGGIATDGKGLPNPNKTNEIEGAETRLSFGDTNYIFSDQLTL